MLDFLREVAYSTRRLLSDRLTTAVALLSLALGLGSYIFATRLLEGLFWASPPGLTEPDRLVRVFGSLPTRGAPRWDQGFSYPDFEAFSMAPATLSAGVAAWGTTAVSVGRGADSVRASATVISPNYFSVLGLTPSRGVLDDAASSEDSVFLADAFWRSHFGGREDILGTVVQIDGRAFKVRAVLPLGFRGLDPKAADLWLPNRAVDWVWGAEARTDARRKFLRAVVRLAPGAEVGAAREAFTAIATNRAKEVPRFWSAEPRVALAPLPPGKAPSPPPEARIARSIAALSLALLLAAIANVAHWLIVRTLGRERDLAVRSALGAPARLLWQGPFLELALAMAAGLVVGFCVQGLGDSAVERLLPLAAHGSEGEGLRLAAVTLMGAGVTLGACSLFPFLWSRRLSLVKVLEGTGRGVPESPKRLRSALPLVQVAVATLLVAVAGTFFASLRRMEAQDLGLAIDPVLLVMADFGRVGLPEERGAELLRNTERRIQGLPGVEATSLVATVPFETAASTGVSIPGAEELPELSDGGPYWNAVSPGYFSTMGLQLRSGRVFDETDRADSAQVVVINETLARIGFVGDSPLGRCLVLGEPGDPCATIVGVVADSRRQRIREAPAFQVYVPLGQPTDFYGPRAVLVRASGRPEDIQASVRREAQSVHPDMPAVEVRRLRDRVDPQYRPWRLGVAVFGVFGWVALALAFAGLYAVTARSVLERRREGAIRLALGAPPEVLARDFVARGLRVAGLGAAIGLAAAVVLVRTFGPDIVDDLRIEPVALGGAALATCGISALAAYLPARRFRRVDPGEVLREG